MSTVWVIASQRRKWSRLLCDSRKLKAYVKYSQILNPGLASAMNFSCFPNSSVSERGRKLSNPNVNHFKVAFHCHMSVIHSQTLLDNVCLERLWKCRRQYTVKRPLARVKSLTERTRLKKRPKWPSVLILGCANTQKTLRNATQLNARISVYEENEDSEPSSRWSRECSPESTYTGYTQWMLAFYLPWSNGNPKKDLRDKEGFDLIVRASRHEPGWPGWSVSEISPYIYKDYL